MSIGLAPFIATLSNERHREINFNTRCASYSTCGSRHWFEYFSQRVDNRTLDLPHKRLIDNSHRQHRRRAVEMQIRNTHQADVTI